MRIFIFESVSTASELKISSCVGMDLRSLENEINVLMHFLSKSYHKNTTNEKESLKTGNSVPWDLV